MTNIGSVCETVSIHILVTLNIIQRHRVKSQEHLKLQHRNSLFFLFVVSELYVEDYDGKVCVIGTTQILSSLSSYKSGSDYAQLCLQPHGYRTRPTAANIIQKI